MITQPTAIFQCFLLPAIIVSGVVTALIYCVQHKRTTSTATRTNDGIFDSLPDALIILDATATIVSANAAALRMLGYQLRELQGTPSSLLFPLSSFRRALHTAQSVRNKANHVELREVATDLVTPSGENKGVSVTVSPLNDTVPRSVVRVRELPPRSQSNGYDAYELSSLTALAAGIGHELSDSLSSIARISSAAGKSVDNPHAVRRILDQITRTAHDASKLARKLPEFGTDLKPQKSRCDLEPIVRTLAERLTSGTDIMFEYEFDTGLSTALVDEKMIEQVLTNMILNSVQAMPYGGLLRITGTARYSIRQIEEKLLPKTIRISITDSGIGIHPENIRKIFDAFYTTKTGATGLGLASSAAIVKRHGGDITVHSTPGKGTTFHIFLPSHSESGPPIDRAHHNASKEPLEGLLLMA